MICLKGNLAFYLKTKGTPIYSAWVKSPCFVLYELAQRAPGQNLDMELGGKIFHVVQNADAARHILRDNLGNYPKYFGGYQAFFGESRLTTDGDVWRKLRDRSQPFITAAAHERVIEVATPYFAAAVETLLGTATGGTDVNVDGEIDFAAARTVSDTVLGFPFEVWGHAGLHDMRVILRFTTFLSFPTSSPGSSDYEGRRATALEALSRLKDRFFAAAAETDKKSDGLLGLIQRADNTGVDLFGEIVSHLFAGFDTSAAAISWALYLLAVNPTVQERLRQQVLALPAATSEYVDAMGNLFELRAFIQEALRIFPPIPFVSRKILNNDAIGSWSLRKENLVILSVIGLHQDNRVFPDPMSIDLARHPDGRTPRELSGNFLPFGDGQRVCPGSRFANAEILAALVAFLQRVRIMPGGSKTLEVRWDASLRREHGNLLRLIPL